MIPNELHIRICRYLAACPPAIAGQEGSTQTYTVACNLYNGFALTEDDLYAYLCEYNHRCQPPWSESELRHKVAQAAKATYKHVRGCLLNGNGSGFKREDYTASSFDPVPRALMIDPATAIEVFLREFSCGESELLEASPVKPSSDFSQDGRLLVEHLFKPGEIVNFVTEFKLSDVKAGGKKAVPFGYGDSVERNELLDRWALGMPSSEAGGWMRMNPMTGDGVADKNVTTHRHCLLEFDSIPPDLQLSFFARLPLPISCVMTSGGKSLHAWVKLDSMDATGYRDDVATLLKMLARFGLDAKNKNPSRLSRLPGVIRKLGATGDGRQRLLYLNPAPSQRRIVA